ncbi:MAG: DUF456 domain-containing protein [Cyclobacteriaceae bacterium]|nr:DUF456 domain-containing protein [Cyclobacteriaceae bacterium]MDH4297237.1 DUF456 domain-containing protein [Cyclobacteriaceae bacterium]MDH5250822.1 DUF456 domain-containing protein [Cyclobacteriaceae bacterium]
MIFSVLFVIGVILMVIGIAGCFLPILPGPPLCFLALLIQQFNAEPPFETDFLLLWGGVTVLVTLLDYLIPAYGAKKFGGSKLGMWGCTIGLVVGFWLGPLGFIVGPFAGAFVGEIIASNNASTALKSAMGSFIGFLAGTLLKLVVCLALCWYYFQFVYRFWAS